MPGEDRLDLVLLEQPQERAHLAQVAHALVDPRPRVHQRLVEEDEHVAGLVFGGLLQRLLQPGPLLGAQGA
ncbi:hypothetical protein D3C72_2536610 [compost metagenome]